MKNLARRMTPSLSLLGLILAMSVGCASRGPAERTGRTIDREVQGAKDLVAPPGPVEKAGRSVDRAINP